MPFFGCWENIKSENISCVLHGAIVYLQKSDKVLSIQNVQVGFMLPFDRNQWEKKVSKFCLVVW